MASPDLVGPGANPGGHAPQKAGGATAASRAPTSLVRVRILAGPVLHLVRRGPERLGYLWAERSRPCGSIPRIRPHPTTATTILVAAGRSGSGYRLLSERSQVR